MRNPFYLVTETSFHASYLVNAWGDALSMQPSFRGIAVREERRSIDFYQRRESFHQRFHGLHSLDHDGLDQLALLYANISETDLAMIKLFGVPAHAVTSAPGTIFLGNDLNNKSAWQWLSGASKRDIPFLFIFLDQLLQPWWIELTHAQIINGHSAVLPYARGMYAIENMAISQDSRSFARAAGATTHYIDGGIDTGPIIKTVSLRDSFAYDSIWELKAASFYQVFELLISTAQAFLNSQNKLIGSFPDMDTRGPNFNRRSFTGEARTKAIEGYLKMKTASLAYAR